MRGLKERIKKRRLNYLARLCKRINAAATEIARCASCLEYYPAEIMHTALHASLDRMRLCLACAPHHPSHKPEFCRYCQCGEGDNEK